MAATHTTTEVEVDGIQVPVALWYPEDTAQTLVGEVHSSYEYIIDIGGIAKNLRVGWLLGWLPRKEFKLPSAASDYADPPLSSSRARPGDAIIFTHGFLGSPLDMAHICEALAARGFTVAAPEFPESLCASYANLNGITRAEIVAATRELVDSGSGGGRWGLFGHSAGAGTTLTQPGVYALGRCALCPGFRGYGGADPMLVIASEGDAVNKLLVSNGVDVQANLLADTASGRGETTMYERAADVFAEQSPPRRGALIYQIGGQPAVGATQPPNHISFLWTGVDEAMIEVLSPFLPLARALRLFVLDFDTYLEARDAEATAAEVAPAVLRFFAAGSRR